MRKLFTVGMIFGLCMAAGIASGGAQTGYTLDQVYGKLDQVSKSFKTIETSIERTYVTIIVPDDKEIKSGKFYFARAGRDPRLKIEITKPAAEFMLIDKDLLQVYNPKLKQVQQASVAQHRDMAEMLMATGFGQSSADMKKSYDVTLVGEEVVDGQKTTMLDLKPLKISGSIKTIRLWMDQQRWIAVQNKFTEPNGDYLVIKFTNIKLNAGIPDSQFKLDLPKGVTFIKM